MRRNRRLSSNTNCRCNRDCGRSSRARVPADNDLCGTRPWSRPRPALCNLAAVGRGPREHDGQHVHGLDAAAARRRARGAHDDVGLHVREERRRRVRHVLGLHDPRLRLRRADAHQLLNRHPRRLLGLRPDRRSTKLDVLLTPNRTLSAAVLFSGPLDTSLLPFVFCSVRSLHAKMIPSPSGCTTGSLHRGFFLKLAVLHLILCTYPSVNFDRGNRTRGFKVKSRAI